MSSLALELGISERTLRRAALRGTLRAEGLNPLRLGLEEESYLLRRWPLLEGVLATLRTQHNVRLAVLFGSAARGVDGEDSDIDLLVRLRDDTFAPRARAVTALEQALGRRVHVVTVGEAPATLLADALRDGRVVVDRDGDWADLRKRALEIQRAAGAAAEREEREAWAVLERLEDLL